MKSRAPSGVHPVNSLVIVTVMRGGCRFQVERAA